MNQTATIFPAIMEKLRANKSVVIKVLVEGPSLLKYACASLQQDKSFIIEAIEHGANILEYVGAELKADKEVVLTSMTKYMSSFQHASDDIKKMCEGANPLDVLQRAIAWEKLFTELPQRSAATRKAKI